MPDKQDVKRVIVIEPGDILMIRLNGFPFTAAEAHQFGAAMQMLEINALVVDDDFKLKKIPRELLQQLMEKSDAQAQSGFAGRPGREPGDAVPAGEPDRGSGEQSTDRGWDGTDGAAPAVDRGGFLLHDRRRVE